MSPAHDEHRFELLVRESNGATESWDVHLSQGERQWRFASLLDLLVWLEGTLGTESSGGSHRPADSAGTTEGR